MKKRIYSKSFLPVSIVLFMVLVGFLFADDFLALAHNPNNGQKLATTTTASFPGYTQEETIAKSRSIVVGEVTGILREYAFEDIPFTDFRFKVEKVVKPPEQWGNAKNLIVTQDGNHKQELYPMMQKKEKYLLFLRRAKSTFEKKKQWVIVGGPSGKYQIRGKTAEMDLPHQPEGKELTKFISEIKNSRQ